MRTSAGLLALLSVLFFSVTHLFVALFMWQHYKCLPGETVFCSSLNHSVAIHYKYSWFPAWSDNAPNEILLILYNPALRGKGRRDLGERKKARRSVSHKPCDQQCVSLSVTDNCLSRLLTTGLPSFMWWIHIPSLSPWTSECCLQSESHYYMFWRPWRKLSSV